MQPSFTWWYISLSTAMEAFFTSGDELWSAVGFCRYETIVFMLRLGTPKSSTTDNIHWRTAFCCMGFLLPSIPDMTLSSITSGPTFSQRTERISNTSLLTAFSWIYASFHSKATTLFIKQGIKEPAQRGPTPMFEIIQTRHSKPARRMFTLEAEQLFVKIRA